jgi:glycosyltransferase involved in cell wall biosynthesis
VAQLPVSAWGPPKLSNTDWLQKRFAQLEGKIVIISFGVIRRERLSRDLVRVAQTFPFEWQLVLHGFGSAEEIGTVRALDTGGRVCLSLEIAPTEQRDQVICSADVGLVVYADSSLNDRLTGFSSEKIALCLQCGVPIVALRYETYEHIEIEGAGKLVDTLEEIPAAVSEILADYSDYQRRARKCYERYYRFEENFLPVFSAISEVSEGVTPRGLPL